MSRLVVGKQFHTYSLDGERISSVSAIKGVLDKPGMVYAAAEQAALWAAGHVEDLPVLGEMSWIKEATFAYRRDWDAKANAGKQVHSIAERLVFGQPVDTTDPETGEEYPDDVIRMGAQVAHFMDRWDVTPDTALVECSVFHDELRYAGTFDLCATLRGGQRWLIDYKTGGKGVYPETALQLTGYARCTHIQIGERDMLMPPIDRCAALWVRPDGWELLPVLSDDRVWLTFTLCQSLLSWTRLKREDVIAGALPIPEGDAS